MSDKYKLYSCSKVINYLKYNDIKVLKFTILIIIYFIILLKKITNCLIYKIKFKILNLRIPIIMHVDDCQKKDKIKHSYFAFIYLILHEETF